MIYSFSKKQPIAYNEQVCYFTSQHGLEGALMCLTSGAVRYSHRTLCTLHGGRRIAPVTLPIATAAANIRNLSCPACY